MRDYGVFSNYSEVIDAENNIAHISNENGVDWYSISNDADHDKGLFLALSNNIVKGGTTNPQTFFPRNCHVMFIAGETNFDKYEGKMWNGKRFVEPVEVVPDYISRTSFLLSLLDNEPSITEGDILEKLNGVDDVKERERMRIMLKGHTIKTSSVFIDFLKKTFKISKSKMEKLLMEASKS